jgi:Fe2+ transport system protein FeoA
LQLFRTLRLITEKNITLFQQKYLAKDVDSTHCLVYLKFTFMKRDMLNNHSDISCQCLHGTDSDCKLQQVVCPADSHPLTECCGCGRVKVSKVRGDRKSCARMATLGVLPGTEMELLCPSRGQRKRKGRGQERGGRCMVKVNGGTLSLDQLTAENIYVTPL